MADAPLQAVLVCVTTYFLWKVLRTYFVKTALDNLPGPPSPSILFGNSDIGYFNIFDGVSYNNWRLYLLNAYKEPPKYFVR